METEAVLKKAPKYRFVVFIEMLLCYILVYAGIQIVNTLGQEIMADMHFAERTLGMFSSIMSLSQIVMTIAGGVLMVKFGGKKLMVGGLLLIALSGLGYLLHPSSVAVLFIVRIIQGFGVGMMNGVLMTLVCVWFPAKERGTAQGVLACFYGASTSIVTVYCALMNNTPWNQTAGYLLLVCGAVFALMIIFGYKDINKAYGVNVIDEAIEGYDPEAVARAEAEAKEKRSQIKGRENIKKPQNWNEVLRYPAFWILGISMIFYAGSCIGGYFVMPLYLNWCGFEAAKQTSIMAYGSLATLVFCLVGGLVSDRVFKAQRGQVFMIAFGGAAICALILFLTHGTMSAGTMTVMFFLMIGFSNFAGGPAFAIATEMVAPQVAQSVNTVSLAFNAVGSFIVTSIYGAIIQVGGGNMGMLSLCICMALCFVGATIMCVKYKA